MRSSDKPEDNYRIEEAIKFLVFSVEKTGTNPKPMITHCIRVAFGLDTYGYGKEVVLAAILHDLLEDTRTSYFLKIAKNKIGKEKIYKDLEGRRIVLLK